jgi:peptidoglycan hydrolase-like protein with peptidoglycan-binding domain
MRKLFCKRKLSGLLLAAVAAGTLTVSTVAGQTATNPTKKPAHKSAATKSTTSKGATHSTKNASSAHTSTAHKASTTRRSADSASTKSARLTGSRRSRKTKKVKGQMAPTPERIMEIQEALAKKGMLSGAPTGEWDDSTVGAMKQFQTSNGLNPSGKLDALTLQKLGLGSETAGLAAPIAPPNSQNRLRNLTPEASN